MKRSASLIAAPSDRASSQQPVSCQFCRARKLRCDRGRPCLNCASRKRECAYESDQRPSAHPGFQSPSRQPKDSHSELLKRIERLEQAVFPAGDARTTHDSIGPAKTPDSRLPSQDEEQQRTSQWLEDLLTTGMTAKASTTSPPAFELAAILSDFPTYNDAEMLLDYFTKTIDASYRMLHVPTTWQSLKSFYTNLKNDCPPSATQVSFFLGVFAGSVYVSKDDFQLETAALQRYPQKVLAERWVKQAVRLLTNPPVPPSVRALQTCMNLAHLCTQIEGLSGSFGILSVTGLQMARAMRIHRLDSAPHRERRREQGADMVELEVKRRIWWHMVASDWLLSYVPGPNEGTYTLHPQQMETNHPSNVEDSDIPGGIIRVSEESYSLPLSSPTSMTYSLCRIQVAALVREVVDCLPPSFFVSPGTECCDEVYNKIITLDQKYQQFLRSLPPFFQLTIQDYANYQALLCEKPYLEWQRYLINFVVHTQLARLHRPFLIRGSMQHKFAYSRMQCIRSAEAVIEIRNHAMSNHTVGAFTFVLQHFLMAAMILAMDVCFNPENVQVPVPQRKQYVLQACRALEGELKAKTIPLNGEANENTYNSQLMVRSFQRAVQSLRGLLRKRMNEDETSCGHIIGNQASHTTGNPSEDRRNHNATHEQQRTYGEQDAGELEGTHDPSELTVDELLDEFFTVGSTLNDTGWDTFLLDVEQLDGVR